MRESEREELWNGRVESGASVGFVYMEEIGKEGRRNMSRHGGLMAHEPEPRLTHICEVAAKHRPKHKRGASE
ncbi:unnamed protein product [Sphenostylis stenocarpa]|uniref:Uncharacterized protein n=1 Tax=Sphenostylis stenocarpa TaxID=92480 RepID=A0AA86S663_9FABA|nr:unnamed protein product [Sphenostylis stenocarpa]